MRETLGLQELAAPDTALRVGAIPAGHEAPQAAT